MSESQIAGLLLLLVALPLLVFFTIRARAGRRADVRPIGAFDRLPDQVGRAAETGRALHLGLGSGGLGSDQTVTSLAAFQVLEPLADSSVAYDAPPIVTVGDPTLLPLAQDALRRAYLRQGIPERYNPAQVRFISPTPLGYATGAADVVTHEEVNSNVLAGSFGQEVSLIADACLRRDLPDLAAADAPRALGALYPAADHLAVGEELYAAGARLTGLPRYLASLRVQDILRLLLVAFILIAVLLETLRF